MTPHIEVDNLPSVMADDKETVEQGESHRRNREEVQPKTVWGIILAWQRREFAQFS
jgi:hypothetical protein